MRQMYIALCLIQQNDKYLMQLRNGDPKIGGAGLVGCFGGKLEPGETSHQAAHREMGEETSHQPHIHDLTYVGEVNVESDHMLEPVKVCAHVYKVMLDSAVKLEAAEGKLVQMTLDQVKESFDTLTTGTRACFETLVFQGSE